jgi:hypothetical protein
MGMDIEGRDADNKLGEVAHGGQQMTVARVGDGGAWAPEIAVQDEHRGCNGPAV